MRCPECGSEDTADGCTNPNCERWRFASAFDDAVIDAGRIAREADYLRDLLAAEGYDVTRGMSYEIKGEREPEYVLAVKHYERGDFEVIGRWWPHTDPG